ncbi:DUF4003 family protein [Peribacillus alkalitolerans]|uniref:DUF4003 family protein n=1 Tax=Peribacillus alkalitolerans TaxID=1550385 RepID=UPI0013CF67FE|nr:DUF4003 family protein [Peribacillus alkalitolerans]
MLDLTLNERIELYKDIYSQLYSSLKWKADKRFLMLISAMYVTTSKEFNLKRFVEVADYVKDEVGMFSYLKSAQRFTTAAALDTSTEEIHTSFNYLLKIYEALIEKGFSRTPFSYIAASTLLKVDDNRMDDYIQKTIDIYKGMKDHHFFLTNSGDYPLAAILSMREKSADELVNNVEDYYRILNQKGLYKGNDLQFLSHVLALNEEQMADKKAEQFFTLKTLLERAKIKTKMMYYPYIGMLTFLEKPESEIDELVTIYTELNNDRLFKWNKDVNFMLSVMLFMSHKTTIGDATRAGLNVTIETLIQAQQAAMTASITAATAADSSSSGSDG